ncbi:hypothetical protein KIW84_055420 [Lathyrus oleraceus]|uniref:Uncharacterized protein n=1 Tax=Pisum sativum TaxID=3888 RepID=A0A9D4WYP0_PEA|nr:hypothetical protein KIW84_055420 [Pisum sativum]
MPLVEGAFVNLVLDGPRGVYEVYWGSMTSRFLKKPAMTGRVAKGPMILIEYDIRYTSQKAIKGSVLSDYIAPQPTEDCQPMKFEFPDEDISRYSNRKIESDRSQRRGLTLNPNRF